MLTPSKIRGEIGVALVLLGIALFLIKNAARMPMGSTALPGPGLMPLSIGVMMAIASAVLLTGIWIRRKKISGTVSMGSRNILMAGAGLIWVSLFFEQLGFFISMAVFLLILSKQFSRAAWMKSFVFAILSVGGAYWFFVHMLGVSLPISPF